MRAEPEAAFVASMNHREQSESELTDEERGRLDAYFDEGSTALMHAAANGHHPVIRQLIMHGANVELKGTDGQSALVHAVKSGIWVSVAFLLAGW